MPLTAGAVGADPTGSANAWGSAGITFAMGSSTCSTRLFRTALDVEGALMSAPFVEGCAAQFFAQLYHISSASGKNKQAGQTH